MPLARICPGALSKGRPYRESLMSHGHLATILDNCLACHVFGCWTVRSEG
jgi:hypothetical protein